MKKLIILIGFGLYWSWFCCQVCDASPFLVSDPITGNIGAQFEIYENNKSIVIQNNESDGSIRYDLKDVAIGVHNYQIRTVKIDPVWGKIGETPFIPFQFTRPTIVTGNITGLKLVP